MKFFKAFLLVSLPLASLAQSKIVSQAIVHSKSEINFPQNFNRPGGGEDDGGGPPSGMESKNTVYMKGELIKTVNQSDFGNNITIVDKKNKTTTTLIEAMGRRTGFTINDSEQEEVDKRMEARMDSLRLARGNNAPPPGGPGGFAPASTEIVETDDTRKIAGQLCKKAIIRMRSRQGETNEIIVWYTPDFKMADGYPMSSGPMGGGRGFAGRNRGGFINAADMAKINGFVMGYEMARPNGFSMKMEVTKIELDANIADKIFEVPKGYEMKTAQEVQNMFLPGGRP